MLKPHLTANPVATRSKTPGAAKKDRLTTLDYRHKSPEYGMIKRMEKTVKHNLDLTQRKYYSTRIELNDQHIKFKNFNNFNRGGSSMPPGVK